MKIGFVVNPLAGAGGKVALKGSDDIEKALERGGIPYAPIAARKFSMEWKEEAEIITCSSVMGGDYIHGRIIYEVGEKTTAYDTMEACRIFAEENGDAIVFVGGDGTARDVYNAVGDSIPLLGVPSGVKMYSSVFALNPRRAAILLHEFLAGRADVVEREIMDVDEDAFRRDELKIKLYGIARTPFMKYYSQGGKMLFSGDEEAKRGMAKFISMVCRNATCILGPGSTVKAVAEEMGVEKTLLGVDVVRNGEVIAKDAGEMEILDRIEGNSKIVVSPVGGSNFIFGRGNQQISAEVIKRVGVENIIVVATPSKMMHAPFLHVDTGDDALNRQLAGWQQVIVGYGLAVRKRILY